MRFDVISTKSGTGHTVNVSLSLLFEWMSSPSPGPCKSHTHLPRWTTGLGTATELIQAILPTSSSRLFLPDVRLLGKPASFNVRPLKRKRQRDFPSRMIFLPTVTRDCGRICTRAETRVGVLWMHLSGDYPEVGRTDALRLILRPKRFKLQCRLLHGKCMQDADHRGKLKSGNLAG